MVCQKYLRISVQRQLFIIQSQDPRVREYAPISYPTTTGSLKRVMRLEKTSDEIDSRRLRRFGLAVVQHAHGKEPLNTITRSLTCEAV